MNNKILACIDHSSYSTGVCDYAVWAAQQLAAPLEFAHVLTKSSQESPNNDLSGSIGLGAQEDLLEQLSSLDAQRNKLAQEGGRRLLDGARVRALAGGASEQDTHARQWHGDLIETLLDLQHDVRMFVLGQRGEAESAMEAAKSASQHIGSNLERVVRSLHRPILVAPRLFKIPRKIMIAFDASATTKKGVEMVASSPLFRGLSCHLVMVGTDSEAHHEALAWARTKLEESGFVVSVALRQGDAESVLTDQVHANDIDLLIMGAYGHSRIRQFIVGSTTTTLLRTSSIPVLLLR
ncbi:MAG: nucleotide-binding universal stress UspA family protein [Janthinobacterium sp.]|jgi:nucleotide-binding universal stress UspA family protein